MFVTVERLAPKRFPIHTIFSQHEAGLRVPMHRPVERDFVAFFRKDRRFRTTFEHYVVIVFVFFQRRFHIVHALTSTKCCQDPKAGSGRSITPGDEHVIFVFLLRNGEIR